jgi:signal transduction histidine kinase
MILLDNAFEFTPDSATVHVRGALNGGEVRISVVDTGSGIAAGDLPLPLMT